MPKEDIYGGGYNEYLKSISHFKPLSLEEEKENFLLYKTTGDEKYRNRIIEANLKYVVTVANQYRKYGIPIINLISEGNEGLFYAIEKFDYEKANVKIFSYATHWIRYKISAAVAEIMKQNNHDEEFTDTGKNREPEREYDNYYQNHPLLDDVPIDEKYTNMTEQLMVCLDDRELRVMKKLFGIGNNKQKSIKEISAEMELSQERISQLRDRAILKMQSTALIRNISYN
jgi:RNA polymerase sigma factor (sigma-70 family)